ncbi:anti-sigma E factor [Vibrio sp. 10N.286.49.B3]|nr:anti-sigma E factor [Vibrio sp. 10N.286.49.B3]
MADKEKLSALMDGEVIDKALISELEQDQESLQTWQDYHLIGDVLRGDTPDEIQWNIADNVAQMLEDEPAHNSLNSDASNVYSLSAADSKKSMVAESQPTPKEAKRQMPAWISQFGQVAVAACVSLAVVLGVQQYGGDDPSQPQIEQLPVLQTIPFSGSVEPVSLTRESFEKDNNSANIQEQRLRVNAMLQDYELQLRLNSSPTEASEHIQESVIE